MIRVIFAHVEHISTLQKCLDKGVISALMVSCLNLKESGMGRL